MKTTVGYSCIANLIGLVSIFVLIAALPGKGLAQNPTVSYSTPQTYTVGTAISPLAPTSTAVGKLANSTTPIGLGTGFKNPGGVGIDSKGNIYVADYGNNAVKEIPFATNNTVTIGSGFNQPNDVKVDAAGNIYIADSGNNEVKEIPAAGGPILVLGSGFNYPAALALDKAGNIFVADANNNAIKKIPAGGGAPVTLAGGLNNPYAVVVDVSGNVYFADLNNALVKIPVTGGSLVTLDANLSGPNAMAIDNAGNIFIADAGHGAIAIVPGNGTSPFNLNYKFGDPFGVAIDAKDRLFVTDDDNNALEEFLPLGGYAISAPLPAGLIFSNGTGIITGTPTASSAAKTYTITGYNTTGTGTANLSIAVNLPPAPTLSYKSPQTYNVGTAITALAPTSTGVAALNYNLATSTIGSGFAGPMGVAVDTRGNVYMTDPTTNLVKEIPAGNGTPVVIGSGFNTPTAVAVDAAGDVFVADYGNNAIKKIPAGNGAPVVLGSGFLRPFGVAVDAAGNVYVGDQGNNDVKKIPAGNGTPVVLASGLNYPDGVSVDAAGNVYFADLGNNEIKKIPAAGGTPIVVGTGFVQPVAVASDINGNLYVADRNNNAVKEIIAGSGTTVTIGSGFNSPYGIAVDGAGNVYVGDNGNYLIKKIKPSGGYYINGVLPAGLVFNNVTGVISGTPTVVAAAKGYTITAYSGGGSAVAALNITVDAAINNATLSKFVISSGTLTPVFASGTTAYTASVINSVASITIRPTATNPKSTIKVNGVAVVSGSASQSLPLAVGANVITTIVTAQNGTATKTYTLKVTRAANANLSAFKISRGTLTPFFSSGTTSYTASIGNGVASMTVTPTSVDPLATIKVNGLVVKSGSVSQALPLVVGLDTITTVVTATDGVTTKTYRLIVTEAKSTNDNLSALKPSAGTLSPAFSPGTTAYTETVANSISSITITPTTAVTTSTVKVNGVAVKSGTASAAIALAVGANVIKTATIAQDGVTTKTYTLTVTRSASSNANLSTLGQSVGGLTPSFSSNTTSYTDKVSNATATITLKPVSSDAHATIKVNGTAVTSGTMTAPIALAVGSNLITTVVTAQDSTTTKTYTLTVTRASGGADSYIPITIGTGISITKPTEAPTLADDGVQVHQGVSPNGDGINDFLQIDNISQYPDNTLMIMNRNGQMIYEAKGYNNTSKVFDGHSTKSGQMQLPGTYFYQLDYTANGITKHKTGFLMLKY